MSDQVTVRRVKTSDEEGLYDLWREFGSVYTKEKLARPLGIEWMVRYIDEDSMIRRISHEFATDDRHVCFVAESDGQLIGFISGYLDIEKERLYDRKGYIEDWFVGEEYRGAGIGRQLWEALMVEFETLDCSWIQLDVFASNPTIKFYESQGFATATVRMVKRPKDREGDSG